MSIQQTYTPEREAVALYIISRPGMDFELERFTEAIDSATPADFVIGSIDAAGADGARMIELYGLDANELPAVLLLEVDDSVYQSWYDGVSFPDPETVIYEIKQIVDIDEEDENTKSAEGIVAPPTDGL